VKKIKHFSDSIEESVMSPKIDYEEINKIIRLLEEKNLSHFELEIEGFKIKLSRNIQPTPSQSALPNLNPSVPYSLEEKDKLGERDPLSQATASHLQNNLHIITSPMVGTFYRAPDPNSPPFVEIGDVVKKKQTLCIIEAMKLMNEIESDADGIIKEIYVENGKPTEYGQKLFAILPTSTS